MSRKRAGDGLSPGGVGYPMCIQGITDPLPLQSGLLVKIGTNVLLGEKISISAI